MKPKSDFRLHCDSFDMLCGIFLKLILSLNYLKNNSIKCITESVSKNRKSFFIKNSSNKCNSTSTRQRKCKSICSSQLITIEQIQGMGIQSQPYDNGLSFIYVKNSSHQKFITLLNVLSKGGAEVMNLLFFNKFFKGISDLNLSILSSL